MISRVLLKFGACSLALCSVRTTDLRAQKLDSARPAVKTPQTLPPVIMRVNGVSPDRAGIGKTILVQIDSLREAMRRDGVDPRKFVLYLNGHPIWNVRGELVSAARGILEFRLARADTSQDSWVALLGSPKSMLKKGVAVGVGYGENPELDSAEGYSGAYNAHRCRGRELTGGKHPRPFVPRWVLNLGVEEQHHSGRISSFAAPRGTKTVQPPVFASEVLAGVLP